ncbi:MULTISPECIES: nuclease-related domain-containing protein [Dehalobacter]|uniref:nuclease-related domain-containing protein n=1 Tax=Dehalobacter TaxID=56112 RepID=UPI0002EB9D08|nr:nuclease-related domain-containing protein [Dehalobacter sp.]MDJ0304561.1 nuclease-related domain-containing protein [Dehalobacter sp.]
MLFNFLKKLLKLNFRKIKPSGKKSLGNKSIQVFGNELLGSNSIYIENRRKSLRKGELAEYKIQLQLDNLGYKVFNDLLVLNQKSLSGYSQIDHVLVSPYGIFVIETKNYFGNIYGVKNNEKWNCVGYNKEYKFYNPLWQNFGHIQALKLLLKDYANLSYYSIVTFTRRCCLFVDSELKNIALNELVIFDTDLSDFIERKIKYISRNILVLNELQIKRICEILSLANIENRQDYQIFIDMPNVCSVCSAKVSHKIKSYCFVNRRRFGGKVFCYDHQKRF